VEKFDFAFFRFVISSSRRRLDANQFPGESREHGVEVEDPMYQRRMPLSTEMHDGGDLKQSGMHSGFGSI